MRWVTVSITALIYNAMASATAIPAVAGDASSLQKPLVFKTAEAALRYTEGLTKDSAKGVTTEILTTRDEKRRLEVFIVKFTTADGKKRVVYLGYPIDIRDYLQRGEVPWGDEEEWELAYGKQIKRVLSRGWQPDVVLRTVDLPPFSPERVVGIARQRDGYYAFNVEASSQIWSALHDHKEDLGKIRPINRGKLVSEQLVTRMASLWRAVLSDSKNYRKDRYIYTDSSSFAFFVGFSPREHLAATTSAWAERGSKARELFDVTVAIIEYATGKSPQASLERAIGKAEARVGIKP